MTKITVAGSSGDIGGRVIDQLAKRGAQVVALVRPGASAEKRQNLERAGVTLTEVDFSKKAALTRALEGSACVVSTLQGLRDVIVDVQWSLVEAAVEARVPRFIPSDFASDFSKLPRGQNRNFDLRLDFHERIDNEPAIAATSIYNGAFAEILAYGTPPEGEARLLLGNPGLGHRLHHERRHRGLHRGRRMRRLDTSFATNVQLPDQPPGDRRARQRDQRGHLRADSHG